MCVSCYDVKTYVTEVTVLWHGYARVQANGGPRRRYVCASARYGPTGPV